MITDVAAASGIVMYGRERYCPDVERARTRLTELGLNWIEYNIEADEAAREQMRAISGRDNVPTLIVGDDVLVEPSRDEIDRALAGAGLMPITV